MQIRIIAILCIFALVTASVGCTTAGEIKSNGNAAEIVYHIMGSQSALPDMEYLTYGSECFLDQFDNYGINADILTDGCVCYASGIEADEITVLILNDSAKTDEVRDYLTGYIEQRVNSYRGYMPEQEKLAANGKIIVNGRYIALIICPDTDKAENAFYGCFDAGWVPSGTFGNQTDSGTVQTNYEITTGDTVADTDMSSDTQMEVISTDRQTEIISSDTDEDTTETKTPDTTSDTAETTDIPPVYEYDGELVMSAWRNGSSDGLAGKNLAVYNAAEDVIGTYISADMSSFEKEIAIHDYITGWCHYDTAVHSHAPDAKPDPDNANPYGMLINQNGICIGYSTTFQLFMDMLGIECLTVRGYSGNTGGEHMWNLVRIEGNWYFVDVTWDDPTGADPDYDYFNVTSKYMADTNHVWDEAAYPSATTPFSIG